MPMRLLMRDRFLLLRAGDHRDSERKGTPKGADQAAFFSRLSVLD
jgi:hypothetical protein